jgi:hypothetical protein
VLRRQGLPDREPLRLAARDSDVFVTFEGDNTVLLQLVAKTMLSDYARSSRTSTLSGWRAT